MGWGGSPGAGVEKASGRPSCWRRHLDDQAIGEGIWKTKSLEEASGRPSHWRRHLEDQAVEKASGRPSHRALVFGLNVQTTLRWFRKGKCRRNSGLVSRVLQIIDIPQLKLSTFYWWWEKSRWRRWSPPQQSGSTPSPRSPQLATYGPA